MRNNGTHSYGRSVRRMKKIYDLENTVDHCYDDIGFLFFSYNARIIRVFVDDEKKKKNYKYIRVLSRTMLILVCGFILFYSERKNISWLEFTQEKKKNFEDSEPITSIRRKTQHLWCRFCFFLFLFCFVERTYILNRETSTFSFKL